MKKVKKRSRREFIKNAAIGFGATVIPKNILANAFNSTFAQVHNDHTLTGESAVALCNIAWASQSENAEQSMPCGGGDIGLNVWVENGDLLMYISRSGAFDENNTFLKLGRIRIKIDPNPFSNGDKFTQELVLNEGYILIKGEKGQHIVTVNTWVDVFDPFIHIKIDSNKLVTVTAAYESWRIEDRKIEGEELMQCFGLKAAPFDVYTKKDEIGFKENMVQWYHKNDANTIFDLAVKQQGLASIKNDLYDPLANLISGGIMTGINLRHSSIATGTYQDTPFKSWGLESVKPSSDYEIVIGLHIAQNKDIGQWESDLSSLLNRYMNNSVSASKNTKAWWASYWKRSWIYINPDQSDSQTEEWQVGRNYQLFRYMLGCNAYGKYPTKFNGGLFTYDPVHTNNKYNFTPDFRAWGGGSFTAQNQRLVYWPMLKSGDSDMMKAQFDFYKNMMANAALRTNFYWGHKGAAFTEQTENYGLPGPYAWGWKKPENHATGIEFNPYIEYLWDTVLEFCLMILDTEKFTGISISEYLPFIKNCLLFFDEHYRYLSKIRTTKEVGDDGKLVLYPGTACETYKVAYNSTVTISGLKTVTSRLLELSESYISPEERNELKKFLERVPDITFREMQGHKTIAPAKLWERIQNIEIPQLYCVFPYPIYGIGKPDLNVALDTWKFDTEAIAKKGYTGWHQDGIFCARLGLAEEAAEITLKKLKNSGRRFPAFWGPGYDWTPDHNWGGSGMIGLQEMLMQTDDAKIFILPAWPKDWDVDFKLHAPYNTIVECVFKNGKIVRLNVSPEIRKKDIIYK